MGNIPKYGQRYGTSNATVDEIFSIYFSEFLANVSLFEAKERNVIHYSSTFLMKLFVFLILLEVAREQG